MRKLHIALIVLIVGFAISMLGLNMSLTKRNGQLRAQLNAEFQRQAVDGSPVPGWTVPPLKGKDPKGNPLEINLQNPGGKKVLLVFSPSCEVCDENWQNWDKLAANTEIAPQLLPVSFVPTVSADYLQKHRIADRPVLVSLDPDTAQNMRLILTPQTVLVQDGKVVRSWVSRLSDSDIRDITSALK